MIMLLLPHVLNLLKSKFLHKYLHCCGKPRTSFVYNKGDSCEVVRCFPDRSFSLVIHDPPARALCRTGQNIYRALLELNR